MPAQAVGVTRQAVVHAALALLLLTAFSAAYEDGAPPAYSGGFGEQSCHQCHADNPLNDLSGELAVDGLPTAYVPGRRYELAIRLRQENMRSGGLQLSARHTDGRQAGTFVLLDDTLQTVTGDGITYAVHADGGADAVQRTANGWARTWRLAWIAPATGAVVLHLAANAANDDASALGDFVYTLERTVTVAHPPSP